MAFNSIHFLVFLLAVVPLYFKIRGATARKWLLLAASYYFYMVFSIPLVLLLIWSTFLDFFLARRIHASQNPATRKMLLFLSLCGNLGVLFFFKYFNFFAYSLGTLCGGAGNSWVIDSILLPMGISFYTFQTMSYTIDAYRREIEPTRSLLDMALYVSFFPQLVAGPIMRGTTLMPQFDVYHQPNLERIRSGFALLVWGLAKKSFIADPMGEFVGRVYGVGTDLWHQGAATTGGNYSGWAILIATYAFAVQIYCDFSAYTDIARGVARMLGFRLMLNFERPYLALSMRDFWRRWHISLSTWLRDYLYIPLGGNRKGTLRTYANLFITMVLGGLWHGANWTFVIWGALHGGILAGERLIAQTAGRQRSAGPLKKAVCWFVTFHLVCLSWLFFRANNVGDAFRLLGGILSWQSGQSISVLPVVVLATMLAYQMIRPRLPLNVMLQRFPTSVRWASAMVMFVLIIVYTGAPATEFIYFQF